ncbi:MAG: alpha-amylase [Spirochaetaceae bacterium]|nr:alpha-amylase [Spirochaetaceae bacterium]
MKKLLVIVICVFVIVAAALAVLFVGKSLTGLDGYNISKDNTKEYVRKGTILHCWCWSFKTIEENLPRIAEAGFTAVQTSPANECLVGEDGGLDMMGNGKWYYQYQPVDWKIGNYQLGTKEDFRQMCEAAESYGIKVIVDVVPNHTTPDVDAVSADFIAAVGGFDKLYHKNGFNTLGNYSNRYQCTTAKMGGLPDVNTENPLFQSYFMAYVNDCIECGADGFRYDTAKHIGLPDDPRDDEAQENNFWPLFTGRVSLATESGTVSLEKSDELFIYGEVLQGNNAREADYAEYIAVTASAYGKSLRQMLSSDQLTAKSVSAWRNDAGGEKLVTWVESHDTYANEGESAKMSNFQLRAGYAVIASRKDGTPLFLSRPTGRSGAGADSEEGVQFPAGSRIGNAGNDEFFHPEVVAVNKFRKAMCGLDEEIVNIDDNPQVLAIVRGGKGVVVINVGDESVPFELPSDLWWGTYKDKAHGVECSVSFGTLHGTVAPKQILVIY